jgi:hypothetical protein
MSEQLFTSAMCAGAFLLAIWVYLRLPVLRPRSLGGAVAHVAASFAVLHAAPYLLGGVGKLAPAPYSLALAIAVVVAPSLCYLCTSWLWLFAWLRDGLGRPRGGHPARAAG